MEFDIVHYI